MPPIDVAIVGAGPAGAMAALRLARAGATVTLFDASHPREKPCGGGLTGRALALVADAIHLAALPGVVVSAATIEAQQREASVALTDRGPSSASSLLVYSRAVFDAALLRAAVAAGACLKAEHAIAIRVAGPRAVIRTTASEYQADWVIGADGANSLVRRTFAAPFSRAQLSVAAGYYVHGVSSAQIDIRTMTEQPGYLWSFPRPDHLAVGICASARERVSASTLRAQSLAWIERRGWHRGRRLEPYAWPIPSVGVDRLPVASGPGWLLVGDAAGLVDPLTREGIYYALLSGQWAAEALVSAPTHRAPARYADRILSEIQPELARAAQLSRTFFSPAFSTLLVQSLEKSAAIRDVFADLVTGSQPYLGLRRRLLATGEWRLAGRAIRVLLAPRFAGTMLSVASPPAT